MRKLAPVVALLVAACATTASVNKPLPTVEELNAFGRVKSLMKAQGGVAQPLFKRSSWTDEDWAYTADAVARLKVSSELVRTRFPHDEQWATLAAAVETQLGVVEASVASKDAAAAKTAFADLRRTCNNCHARKYKGE